MKTTKGQYRYFYSFITSLGTSNAVVDLHKPILGIEDIELIQNDVAKIKGVGAAVITSYQLMEKQE